MCKTLREDEAVAKVLLAKLRREHCRRANPTYLLFLNLDHQDNGYLA